MKEKEKLLEMIKRFSEEKTTVKEFWNEYHLYYTNIEATEIFKEYDFDFFDEVNEKLYYTDWQSPADPALIEEQDLLSWIKQNLPLYLNGKWKSEWPTKK